MADRKSVFRAGLDTLYFSGAHRVARQFLAGEGAILTFHRVRPARADPFQPNGSLEITPQFLDEVLTSLRAEGIEIVTLDEVHRRLMAGERTRRFVALTFDDGFRDNLEFAWPVLKRHQAPFTIYVPSDFAEGRGELWWIVLEMAIAQHDQIEVTLDGAEHVFDCPTAETKQATFEAIYRHLRTRETEAELRQVCRELAFGYGIDIGKLCRETCMGWDELAFLANDPLVTIGAHTVMHPILMKLSAEAARAEMLDGARAIAANLGKMPAHFAYPVGGTDAAGPREFAMAAGAGFKTAVTTRPGVLFHDHARYLTALPRISVNGAFQRMRYLDVLLSGAPSALINRFRRVAAA
ncbi:MAG: polysaccharide deacetylase family protein [Bauldia sp.]